MQIPPYLGASVTSFGVGGVDEAELLEGRLYMAKEVPNSGVSAQCLCRLFSFQLQRVAEAVRGGSHEARGAAQQEEGPEENRTLQTLHPGSEAVCVL